MRTDTTPEALAAVFRAPVIMPDGRRGPRLAIGAAGLFVLGMVFDWPVAYLAPLLAALFLQAPTAPSARAGLGIVLGVFALLFFGFGLFSVLRPYPLVYLIAQTLVLGWAFSLSVAGRPQSLVLLALIMALMMPYAVKVSPELARAMAFWLPANLALALLASWLAFDLLPPSRFAQQRAAQDAAAVPRFDPARRLLRMMLVTLPFVLVFYLAESGAMVTLIYVAILSQQLAASTGAGPKVAGGVLLANIAGGAAALAVYEVLVIAPLVSVMSALVLLLCLGFARWRFSDQPSAPLAGSALTTALILLGGAMAPFGDDVDVAMFDRLIQIGAALAWVLIAFVIADRFLPEREIRPDLSGWWRRTGRRGRGRTPRSVAPRA